MPQRYGTSIDVQFVAGNFTQWAFTLELALAKGFGTAGLGHGEDLDGEGLIDFDNISIIKSPPSLLFKGVDGVGRAKSHSAGVATGVGVVDQTAKGLESKSVTGFF